jgi:hypothetical protein
MSLMIFVRAFLRFVSLLVPGDRRDEWLREW